ncbi:MAG: hypothetical protein K0R84_2912, partial [Clostridia bacterium]|nr:hypothetical protein [Clostridia bacterium]
MGRLIQDADTKTFSENAKHVS